MNIRDRYARTRNNPIYLTFKCHFGSNFKLTTWVMSTGGYTIKSDVQLARTWSHMFRHHQRCPRGANIVPCGSSAWHQWRHPLRCPISATIVTCRVVLRHIWCLNAVCPFILLGGIMTLSKTGNPWWQYGAWVHKLCQMSWQHVVSNSISDWLTHQVTSTCFIKLYFWLVKK